MTDELTPHELIRDSYPLAARSISPLVELAKVNPSFIEEIIELAIVIGINSAHARIERDKLHEAVARLPNPWPVYPMWDNIGTKE